MPDPVKPAIATPRIILHLDMDAFYAAVEVRDNPALRGKPVIIGHRGRRGVVSTCTYEARRFGVRSAMPSVTAQRLCPQGIWLPGRMRHYVTISRKLRRIMADFSPTVEPISIDEAFLDLTGIALDFEAAQNVAQSLKERIQTEQRLTASVGIAANKFLAKVASDMDKPDGLVVLSHDKLEQLLWPLPVARLWGVGPKTSERLIQLGIGTIGDIARASERSLASRLGHNLTAHLRALALGEDDRPVNPVRHAKSISEERTYGEDLRDPQHIDRALLARAEGVARQLRRASLVGRTVQIKVRTGDFVTWTRAATLSTPTDLAEPLIAAARELFRDRIRLKGRGVRLLGLGVSGLEQRSSGQQRLFESPDEARARRLSQAADAVRDRLGEHAVTRARLIRQQDDDAPPDEASSLPSVD